MEAYLPASLPSVSAVEIVVLDGIYPNRVSDYMHLAAGAPSFTVEGEAAARIAELWRRLPPGQQARCHTPPFGLRFIVGGRVVCEASICWECNNIFGDADGTPLVYKFDASDAISQELLAELRRICKG